MPWHILLLGQLAQPQLQEDLPFFLSWTIFTTTSARTAATTALTPMVEKFSIIILSVVYRLAFICLYGAVFPIFVFAHQQVDKAGQQNKRQRGEEIEPGAYKQ